MPFNGITSEKVLHNLVTMEKNAGNARHHGKVSCLKDAIDMSDIDTLEDKELTDQIHSLLLADTVDEQLNYLKQMVLSNCKDIENHDAVFLYKFISKIYFGVDLKNPLRHGVVQLIGSMQDRRIFEMVANAIGDELKLLICNTSLPLNEIDLVSNKLIGCFDNFPAGIRAISLCHDLVVTFICCCIDNCIDQFISVSKSELNISPTLKTELFQCIHSNVRLALLVLQSINDLKFERIDSLQTCVRSLITLPGLPLDTANNCGHLLSLCVKKTSKDFLGYLRLFEEYKHDSNDVIVICISSGILNTLSSEDLIINDNLLLNVIFKELTGIYYRNMTDCNVILCLSRIFVVLSRCLLAIPSVLINLPELTEFLLTHTWIHLDHYMDNVRHLSNTIINNIVKVAASLNSVSQEQNLLKIILEKMVCTPVWKRAKHAALQALTETMPSVEIISSEPDLVKTLLSSLQQPCAPSYMINSVESLMLQHLKEVEVDVWTETWVEPLLDSMATNGARNHGLEKLLTKAICISPQVVGNIFRKNKKNWVLSFCCIRACRKLGINISADDVDNKWRGFVDYSFFNEAVCHKDDEVRLSCLAVLVESKKTTEHFTIKELEVIKLFFKFNFNDCGSAVLHKKLSLISKFLTRIKDSSQVLQRNNKVKSVKNDSANEVNFFLLKEYKFFCEWLVLFCFENLFPGASLGRRSTALAVLNQCQEYGLWPESANTMENAKLLLMCLTDSYEDNKITARKIISAMPLEIFHFDEQLCVQEVFEECLNLGASYRPPDCITGAHLLSTLICFPETSSLLAQITDNTVDNIISGIQSALITVMGQLRLELQVAQSNLIAAAASGPLHGQLLLVRHILEELDLSKIVDSEKWKQLIAEVISSCFECSSAVSIVVSSDSPEGHLPVDIPDIVSESCDVNRTGDLEKVNVTSQMVLLCSWRTIKEVSLILGHLAKCAPVTFGNTEGLITEEQLISIGDHFIKLLVETKHRGAFEQAYTGFCKLTSRLWSFPGGNLHKLPYKWLEETVDEIASDSKICATRRSAGIPYMIQALVCTEIGIGDGSCFEMCMKHLIQLSSSKSHSVDSRIHALNVLRALFRNAELREAVSPYVQDAFIIAISGFKSAVWGERNSATLLFSAMITRVFGVKRTKGHDLSWKNKMTGRIFFQRYPNLYGFLLEQLSCNEKEINDLRPTLYPVLLLLSRLYPSSLEGTDSNLKLIEFLEPLSHCSGAFVMKTRLLAARAVCPLISPTNYVEHLKKLFCWICESKQENFTHGVLLQIIELLKSEVLITACNEEIQAELYDWITLLKNLIKRKKNSFIVLSSVVQVLSVVYSNFYETIINSFWNELACILEFHLFNVSDNSNVIGKSHFYTLSTELLLKLRIFSHCQADIVPDLLIKLFYCDHCYEIKNKILDIILFLIRDENMLYHEEDDEEFLEIIQSFGKMKTSRRVQLKQIILNSERIVEMLFNILLEIEMENVNRILDIISVFPKLIGFILEQKTDLKFLVKSWKTNNEDDFVLKVFCRLPYDEPEVKNSLSEANKLFICEIIVEYIYSNKFLISPGVRLTIAKWFSSMFYHFISTASLPPEIRLSLWSYLVILCLDEDKSVQSVLCDTYCQEKTLQTTLERFLAEENDCIVKATGLSAWIFGSLDFRESNCNECYELNDKPLDKDELESNYEELVLCQHSGICLKQIIAKNPGLSSVKLPNNLVDWLVKHCGLEILKDIKYLADFYKIAESEINGRKQKFSEQYCCFLKFGYKTTRSVLVTYLKEHSAVLKKSILPKFVRIKEMAWEQIKTGYIKTTGKIVTVDQLKKLLQNMNNQKWNQDFHLHI